MSLATFANILTAVFCVAVLVQSVRMMRSLRAMKEGALTDVVGALDAATREARVVLVDLRTALAECAASARTLAQAKSMAEELGVMIGIADATAERLVEQASAANRKSAPKPARTAAAGRGLPLKDGAAEGPGPAASADAAARAAGKTRRPPAGKAGAAVKMPAAADLPPAKAADRAAAAA